MTGPWLEIWKECCFALNWFGPSKQTEIDVMFVQRTQEYGNWFMNHAIMRHGVFIDKCGYNIWTARNHGRARQGERAYRQVCGQRGRNVIVALAVRPLTALRPILSWRCPWPTAHFSTQWSRESAHWRQRRKETYRGPKYRLEWYSVGRDANSIASQGSSALHRCYICC